MNQSFTDITIADTDLADSQADWSRKSWTAANIKRLNIIPVSGL